MDDIPIVLLADTISGPMIFPFTWSSVRQIGWLRQQHRVGDSAFRNAMLSSLVGRDYLTGAWVAERPAAAGEMLVELLVETVSAIESGAEWRNLGLWINACRTVPDDVVIQLREHDALSDLALIALDVAVADRMDAETSDELRTHAIGMALEQCREENREQFSVMIRLAQLAVGGCDKREQVPQVYHGYTAVASVPLFSQAQRLEMMRRIDQLYGRLLESGDVVLEHELTRLVAMTGLCSNGLAVELVNRINDESPVPDDVHNLIVLSLSGVELENEDAAKIGRAIVQLRSKIASQDRNEERNWVPRVSTVIGRLMQQPAVALEIVNNAEFVRQGNEYLFRLAPGGVRQRAQQIASEYIIALEPSEITAAQLEIIRPQAAGHRAFIRECCSVRRVREQAVRILCGIATEEDRQLLVEALSYGNLSTTARVARTLAKIENNEPSTETGFCLKAIMRLGTARPEVSTRDALYELVEVRTGEDFGYQPGKVEDAQQEALARLTAFFEKNHPQAFNEILGPTLDQAGDLARRGVAAELLDGDVARGEELFRARSCNKCHQGGNRMGPDLAGITSRFSFSDILIAVAMPDVTVSDRYKAVNFQTIDGELHRGIVIYESMDGVTLGNTLGDTIRLNKDDIEDRSPSRLSPMPAGLAEDFDAQDWADLYAYLKTLD